MPPLFAIIKISSRQSAWPRFWLPLFLVWLILLPLVLVLSPFFLIASLVMRVNPIRVVKVFAEILKATSGTSIEIRHGRRTFFIEIR